MSKLKNMELEERALDLAEKLLDRIEKSLDGDPKVLKALVDAYNILKPYL